MLLDLWKLLLNHLLYLKLKSVSLQPIPKSFVSLIVLQKQQIKKPTVNKKNSFYHIILGQFRIWRDEFMIGSAEAPLSTP